jgi:hypothetical protein
MTVKIFLQHGFHHRTVREALKSTFLLFYDRKTGSYRWRNIKEVKERGVPDHLKEVEFETMEHAQELFEHHPEVKRKWIKGLGNSIFGKFPWIGDRAHLKLGKTDKYTSV